MKNYLVIGNPINHSLSPKLHNTWLKTNNINAFYDKQKLEENEIKNFIQKIKQKKIAGANVTVPFKKKVIPFLDKSNKMFALQGRAFGKEEPKYLTIRLSDEKKLYGLDSINWGRKVQVVEGPIDSLFLDNCVATAHSDLRIDKKDNVTLIPDNEPRNREIVKRIRSFIEDDFSVCLFPEQIKQKDINEMVVSGVKDIKKLIDDNTYKGLEAKVRFNEWRKIDA